MTEQIGNYILLGYLGVVSELGVCMAIAQVIS